MNKLIKVSEDFSMDVSGRFDKDGDYSAEEFRNMHLAPALKKHDKVTVDLDGVYTCGSSFLEESFGGLIREAGLTFEEIDRKLTVISKDDASYIDEINMYLRDAEKARTAKINFRENPK